MEIDGPCYPFAVTLELIDPLLIKFICLRFTSSHTSSWPSMFAYVVNLLTMHSTVADGVSLEPELIGSFASSDVLVET